MVFLFTESLIKIKYLYLKNQYINITIKSMNCNELMTGNIVALSGSAREFKINEILEEHFTIEINGKFRTVKHGLIQGIELTDERIINFGLYTKGFERPLVFHKINEGYNVISYYHLLSTIEFVHQLQNLYHAIHNKHLSCVSHRKMT